MMSHYTDDLNRERRREAAFRASPIIMSEPSIWLFADEYDLAGFVFARINGAACPIDSFQLSENIDQTLSELLLEMQGKHNAAWVLVPRVLPGAENGPEKRANFMFQEVPVPPFNSKLISGKATFSQARLARAKGLQDGFLDESHYKGSRKLIERIKQVNKDNPPSTLLWAYLQGVYDLMRYRHLLDKAASPVSFRYEQMPKSIPNGQGSYRSQPPI